MGSSYTLGDIRDKIETDLDLKEETMISETELNANINEAIIYYQNVKGVLQVIRDKVYSTE